MNDKVDQSSSATPPDAAPSSDSQVVASSDASVAPAAPAAPTEAAKPAKERRPWFNPWLLLALLALALCVWQWFETRSRLAGTQQEMARRLADNDTVVTENRALAQHAQEQVEQMQAKLGDIEGKLAESNSQQAALESLYQDLAGNREEWILAEIEQSVTLAAQQLQLAANIPAAVLALQAADARLAGSNR
ncbi:MAG: uroporphyrinogen-III C-methyltransferase, partial [Propionivibrio sp.]